MIASHGWLNPTRAVGLVAYGTACTCCGISWVRSKTRPKTSRLAAVLMLIESVLLLDIAFDWRWRVHDMFMGIAVRQNEYAQRRLPQAVVVTMLGGLLFFGLLVAWRRLRGRGTTLLAVSGVLLSLIVWCIEVVSLHAVDHVLYHTVDGVMTVTLLWLLSCIMTSIGILLDPR